MVRLAIRKTRFASSRSASARSACAAGLPKTMRSIAWKVSIPDCISHSYLGSELDHPVGRQPQVVRDGRGVLQHPREELAPQTKAPRLAHRDDLDFTREERRLVGFNAHAAARGELEDLRDVGILAETELRDDAPRAFVQPLDVETLHVLHIG